MRPAAPSAGLRGLHAAWHYNQRWLPESSLFSPGHEELMNRVRNFFVLTVATMPEIRRVRRENMKGVVRRHAYRKVGARSCARRK